MSRHTYWRNQAWEWEAEAARLREALGEIVATKNTIRGTGDERHLVLDAEEKMRGIAAAALTHRMDAKERPNG